MALVKPLNLITRLKALGQRLVEGFLVYGIFTKVVSGILGLLFSPKPKAPLNLPPAVAEFRELSIDREETTEDREETTDPATVDSTSSPTSLEGSLRAKLELYDSQISILRQLKTHNNLLIATQIQCIKLQQELGSGCTWIKKELSSLKLKRGERLPATVENYRAYLSTLRPQIELKKDQMRRLSEDIKVLELKEAEIRDPRDGSQ